MKAISFLNESFDDCLNFNAFLIVTFLRTAAIDACEYRYLG